MFKKPGLCAQNVQFFLSVRPPASQLQNIQVENPNYTFLFKEIQLTHFLSRPFRSWYCLPFWSSSPWVWPKSTPSLKTVIRFPLDNYCHCSSKMIIMIYFQFIAFSSLWLHKEDKELLHRPRTAPKQVARPLLLPVGQLESRRFPRSFPLPVD